jgi:uncharacterized protein (TIGR00251 family)
VLIPVKAVPGARADQIAGWLGDRLKVRTAQPPEGGKANAAIARLLADALSISPRQVEIVRGQASPEKTFLALGVSVDQARAALPA